LSGRADALVAARAFVLAARRLRALGICSRASLTKLICI
jgi:hypothetical protein